MEYLIIVIAVVFIILFGGWVGSGVLMGADPGWFIYNVFNFADWGFNYSGIISEMNLIVLANHLKLV